MAEDLCDVDNETIQTDLLRGPPSRPPLNWVPNRITFKSQRRLLSLDFHPGPEPSLNHRRPAHAPPLGPLGGNLPDVLRLVCDSPPEPGRRPRLRGLLGLRQLQVGLVGSKWRFSTIGWYDLSKLYIWILSLRKTVKHS